MGPAKNVCGQAKGEWADHVCSFQNDPETSLETAKLSEPPFCAKVHQVVYIIPDVGLPLTSKVCDLMFKTLDTLFLLQGELGDSLA